MLLNKKTVYLILSLLFIFVFIYPTLTGGIWLGHDMSAHISRLMAVNQEINHHQFPFLFDFFNKNQYGYSWNIYYPPLTAFIFAATYPTHLLGLSIYEQFKISISIIYLICLLSSYSSVKYITKSRFQAFLAMTLYSTSVYFANNFYIRASVGELLAFSLFPLLILCYLDFRESGKFKLRQPMILLSILLSNIPSFLICILFIVFCSCIDRRKLWSKGHLKSAIAISSVFLISSAFYTVPLIWSRLHDNVWAFNGIANNFNSMWLSAASGTSLITGDDKIIIGFNTITSAQRSMGIPLLVALVISTWIYRKKNPLTSIQAAAILSVFMSTYLFPWYILPDSIPLIGLIQFPWRLLIIPTFVASLFCAKLISIFDRKNRVFSALLFSIACLASSYTAYNAILKRVSHVNENTLLYKDYTPADTTVRAILDRKDSIYLNGKPYASYDESFHGGYPNYKITGANGQICLPVISSSLLNIYVNNEIREPTIVHGFACISSNDGREINVSIKPSRIIGISHLISILAFLILIVAFVINKRRTK